MLELKRCKICGKEIGNVYDTDYFALISKQYCSECKKLTDRQNSRIRSKRYRDKKRRELEQAKKTAENLQDEVTDSNASEHGELKGVCIYGKDNCDL